jgi:putative flippase GtrA
MLKMFDKHYGATAGISWMVSYWVVYAFQKYGTFGAMSREARLREIGHYAVGVVGLSTAVNFGLVTVLADYDSTLNKTTAVAAAAVAAAFVAWFVSTRILRIGNNVAARGGDNLDATADMRAEVGTAFADGLGAARLGIIPRNKMGPEMNPAPL